MVGLGFSVRLRKTRAVAALIAVSWLVGPMGTSSAQDRPAQPPAVVHAAAVIERDVASGRTFVGTVEAERTSVLGSEVEGQVVELLAREGDRVEKGAAIAKLRTRRVELQLAEAQADLSSRQAALQELENGSRKEDIDQAKARVDAAAAERSYRDWQHESSRKLFAEQKVSEGTSREAAAAALKAAADERQAKAALALLEAGPRPERIADMRAQVAAAQARTDRLQDVVARSTIRAPFTGYVIARSTEVGQWIGAGDAVVELAALDRVEIVVAVLEDFVGSLAVGAQAQVTVAASGLGPLVGKIARIVPRGDRATRTFPVRVLVENPREKGDVRLKAGMFARATLSVGKLEKGLLVPKDALVLGGRSPIVYLVQPGEGSAPATVVPVPVELGVASGGLIQVRAELTPGAQVVTRGNERLMPGRTVQVVAGTAPEKNGEDR